MRRADFSQSRRLGREHRRARHARRPIAELISRTPRACADEFRERVACQPPSRRGFDNTASFDVDYDSGRATRLADALRRG